MGDTATAAIRISNQGVKLFILASRGSQYNSRDHLTRVGRRDGQKRRFPEADRPHLGAHRSNGSSLIQWKPWLRSGNRESSMRRNRPRIGLPSTVPSRASTLGSTCLKEMEALCFGSQQRVYLCCPGSGLSS